MHSNGRTPQPAAAGGYASTDGRTCAGAHACDDPDCDKYDCECNAGLQRQRVHPTPADASCDDLRAQQQDALSEHCFGRFSVELIATVHAQSLETLTLVLIENHLAGSPGAMLQSLLNAAVETIGLPA